MTQKTKIRNAGPAELRDLARIELRAGELRGLRLKRTALFEARFFPLAPETLPEHVKRYLEGEVSSGMTGGIGRVYRHTG